MAKIETPAPPEPSAEQAAALARAAAVEDAEHSKAKSKELVMVALDSTTVANFVTYDTRTVTLLDPNKTDGSLVDAEVEYPVVITREWTEVPAGLVDSIREAAHAAGLIVNVKD